jgi:hypothetical protein
LTGLSFSPPRGALGMRLAAATHSQALSETTMNTQPHDGGQSAQTASQAGAFVEKAAGAAAPSNSMLGRVGAAASAIKIGAKLLPGAWRMMKRYPVTSSLAIAGLLWAATYAMGPRARRSLRM